MEKITQSIKVIYFALFLVGSLALAKGKGSQRNIFDNMVEEMVEGGESETSDESDEWEDEVEEAPRVVEDQRTENEILKGLRRSCIKKIMKFSNTRGFSLLKKHLYEYYVKECREDIVGKIIIAHLKAEKIKDQKARATRKIVVDKIIQDHSDKPTYIPYINAMNNVLANLEDLLSQAQLLKHYDRAKRQTERKLRWTEDKLSHGRWPRNHSRVQLRISREELRIDQQVLENMCKLTRSSIDDFIIRPHRDCRAREKEHLLDRCDHAVLKRLKKLREMREKQRDSKPVLPNASQIDTRTFLEKASGFLFLSQHSGREDIMTAFEKSYPNFKELKKYASCSPAVARYRELARKMVRTDGALTEDDISDFLKIKERIRRENAQITNPKFRINLLPYFPALRELDTITYEEDTESQPPIIQAPSIPSLETQAASSMDKGPPIIRKSSTDHHDETPLDDGSNK